MSDSDSSSNYSSTSHKYSTLNHPTHPPTNTVEDSERYKAFRRSTFNKNGIRKLVNNILNQTCNANFIISINSVGKVFVGELVEMALTVMDEMGESGAIKPRHVHEAYRRLYKRMPHLRVNDKRMWF